MDYVASGTNYYVIRPHGRAEGDDYHFQRWPFILGFEAGLNYNLFSQKMEWFIPHGTVFDGLTSAGGLSPFFGVVIGAPIDETLTLMLRISYDMKNFSKTTSGNDLDGVLGRAHTMNLTVDVTSAYFTLTPQLLINLDENWFLSGAIPIQFLTGNIETTWKPTSVDGTVLSNFAFWNALGFGNVTGGEATFVAGTGGAETPIKTRIGLEIGAGYKIPLTNTIWLVPQARFQFMLSEFTEGSRFFNLITDETWEQSTNRMLHSLQFALAIWFQI